MSSINTANGAIEVEKLGVTLMHEHIFILNPEINQNYPESWGDEETRVQDAIVRLKELKAAGVDSVVDLTVIGLGRYIPRIKRIAAEININILVATGIYTFDELPHYFTYRGANKIGTAEDPMVEMFVKDITEGIADTGIKAAVLKCATDQPGITPGVERVLRAVGHAHRITGVPISTHTHANTRRGLEQQTIFAQMGVDLTRVIIGHCGDSTDLEYLEEIIANGSYLGMDRFGISIMLSFEDRVNTVVKMCERGHADKMVLSHDANCFSDWYTEGAIQQVLPQWHYLHIHNDVIPALKARGVTDEMIHTMMVKNPKHIFSQQTAY